MSYKDAIAEAYASADLDEVILDTLELRHPAFVDANGNNVAARIVRAYEDVYLTLEADAPQDGGQTVLFQSCGFEFTLPEYGDSTVPQLDLKITNVSRIITSYLEEAIVSLQPIGVTYRPYLASDTTGPQMDPPFSFYLSKVQADVFQITGTATTNDVNNWPFPYQIYTAKRFPGLVR